MAGGQYHESGLRVLCDHIPLDACSRSGFPPHILLCEEIGRSVTPNGHSGFHIWTTMNQIVGLFPYMDNNESNRRSVHILTCLRQMGFQRGQATSEDQEHDSHLIINETNIYSQQQCSPEYGDSAPRQSLFDSQAEGSGSATCDSHCRAPTQIEWCA
jgi:hypothetical protein